jgi:porin
MRPSHYVSIVLFWVHLAGYGQSLSAQQHADQSLSWNRDELTGAWDGWRTQLDEQGIAIEAVLIGDVMRNVFGGVRRKTVLIQNIDVKLLIDTETLLGWKGSTALVSALQNNGNSISAHTGDVQGVSNIEAVQTIRFFEAWIQQNVWENRISLLGGLYDLNSEFDYMESASVFIQSSQGLGGAFAASGLTGPPTFPAAGLGARIRFQPDPRYYLQAGIFDGAPGKSRSLERVDFSWNRNGGTLAAAEAGLFVFGGNKLSGYSTLSTRERRLAVGREVAADYRAKIALGFWNYSRNYADIHFSPSHTTPRDNEQGLYLLVDTKWYLPTEHASNKKHLSVFLRLGTANNTLSRYNFYSGGGITLTGLIPGDETGIIGFSVASVHSSEIYLDRYPDYPLSETVLEWTYLMDVFPWFSLQPDVQYVIHPGAAPGLDNAWVFGLRTNIVL